MRPVSLLAARLAGLPPPTTRSTVEKSIRLAAPDGVELLTDLYLARPVEPRPAVLIRTPYGRTIPWGLVARVFAERGYHAVIQSCRGTFGSGGTLAYAAEAGDGRAAADWIVTQRWSNGDIGTIGPSYLSLVQWALASTRPPQLKAMAIQIMAADRGRSHYPGGAFALDNALTWTYLMEHQEAPFFERARMQRDTPNAVGRAAMHLPLIDADRVLVGHEVPYYREWLEHEPGDEYWKGVDFTPVLGDHDVPTSFVGGWYDYFLPYMFDDFRALGERGVDTQFLVGPWPHSSPQAVLVGLSEGLAWLDLHLKGETGRRASAPFRIEVMGGGGRRLLSTWPPPFAERRFHLQAHRGLAEAAPAASQPDRFLYDPAHPTPAVGGTSLSNNAGPRDNRELEVRPDVLTYTTAALEDDLVVIGPVRAELFMEATTDHFDVFARLCDVDRGGRPVNVCDGIVRCGPGTSQPVRVDLWPTAHRFGRGHRIRLQVSGGSHPRFARNLGAGEPLATGTAMVVSQRTLHHDRERPSALLLPVAG